MQDDHYPRIREQQRLARENAVIEAMETEISPLIWSVVLVAGLMLSGWLLDAVKSHLDMKRQNEVLVQCLNGSSVSLGDDAMLRCQVQEIRLVKGVKSS